MKKTLKQIKEIKEISKNIKNIKGKFICYINGYRTRNI